MVTTLVLHRRVQQFQLPFSSGFGFIHMKPRHPATEMDLRYGLLPQGCLLFWRGASHASPRGTVTTDRNARHDARFSRQMCRPVFGDQLPATGLQNRRTRLATNFDVSRKSPPMPFSLGPCVAFFVDVRIGPTDFDLPAPTFETGLPIFWKSAWPQNARRNC